MVNISAASLQAKIEACAKTPEGQKKMADTIRKYKKEGRATTMAGSPVVPEVRMAEAAAKMISVLRSTAQGAGLPESVLAHFDSLQCSSQIAIGDGEYVVYVYFTDDLSRESLENDYEYSGVDNIIALFNNGAHAKNYIYGWWNGHKPTGKSVYRSGIDSNDAWVRSKKDREGLHFMQQAVKDFNANYGSDYGVTASVGDSYE